MHIRKISLVLLFVAVSSFVKSQEVARERVKWRFSPLPVVYYSPETRFGFGVLLAANMNLGKDSTTTGSYLQSSFIYTLNKQYEWSNLGRIYSPGNKRIFQYRFYFAYFPENFYGYQTEDPKSFEESIEYNRLWIELREFWRIKKKMFVGVYGRMNRLYNLNTVLDGSFETIKPPGYEGYTVFGISPVFHIDSRDSQVYPRSGNYLEVLWIAHPGLISDFTYGNVRLDYRLYRPVNLFKDDVLATQFIVNLNEGTVPFRDMADIGGPMITRGYYRGYFRYKNQYAVQTEYRFMMNKYFGLATWVGLSTLSESWKKPFAHSVKPNFGIGLRLRINQKDKLNLRADYGFGKEQQGLYLDASEAF